MLHHGLRAKTKIVPIALNRASQAFTSDTNAASHTFSSVSVGVSGASGRKLVVVTFVPTANPTGVTFGGVAMTTGGTSAGAGAFTIRDWYLDLTTETSGDIVLTHSVSRNFAGCAVFSVKNAMSGSASSFSNDATSPYSINYNPSFANTMVFGIMALPGNRTVTFTNGVDFEANATATTEIQLDVGTRYSAATGARTVSATLSSALASSVLVAGRIRGNV